jgi:ParB-like chromosome segregation protein Spo0J
MSICANKPTTALAAPLAIVWRPIKELRGDLRKLRTPGPRQIRQQAKTIESFGFNVPILIDRELRVVAGYGRLLAARALGWCEVPTILLDELSPAQARVFLIADNRRSETVSWEDLLLSMQLKELQG